MSTDNKSSYRSIFKATSLFGGVQVYQILIHDKENDDQRTV